MIGRARCKKVTDDWYEYGEWNIERLESGVWRVHCPEHVDRLIICEGTLKDACDLADTALGCSDDIYPERAAAELGGAA